MINEYWICRLTIKLQSKSYTELVIANIFYNFLCLLFFVTIDNVVVINQLVEILKKTSWHYRFLFLYKTMNQ